MPRHCRRERLPQARTHAPIIHTGSGQHSRATPSILTAKLPARLPVWKIGATNGVRPLAKGGRRGR
jgi:hypothetical protein